MSVEMVKTFYGGILTQVLALENSKKELAETILLLKNLKDKLPLIKEFLSLNIQKNLLFEQAAVAAMQNQASGVLEHLGRLYGGVEEDQVIEVIREELERDQRLIETVKKRIKYPYSGTFLERRLLQEIDKYVVNQARQYNKVEF